MPRRHNWGLELAPSCSRDAQRYLPRRLLAAVPKICRASSSPQLPELVRGLSAESAELVPGLAREPAQVMLELAAQLVHDTIAPFSHCVASLCCSSFECRFPHRSCCGHMSLYERGRFRRGLTRRVIVWPIAPIRRPRHLHVFASTTRLLGIPATVAGFSFRCGVLWDFSGMGDDGAIDGFMPESSSVGGVLVEASDPSGVGSNPLGTISDSLRSGAPTSSSGGRADARARVCCGGYRGRGRDGRYRPPIGCPTTANPFQHALRC